MITAQLKAIVAGAVAAASTESAKRARSRAFTAGLGRGIKQSLDSLGFSEVDHVAWRGNSNRIFGATEILYDVGVWRVLPCEANLPHRRTKYIIPRLVIESELAHDATEIMFDFSKLLSCTAEWKIFIGSKNPVKPLDSLLAEAVVSCSGNLIVCAVPPLDHWKAEDNSITVWRSRNGGTLELLN
jgi:hypothetical protein